MAQIKENFLINSFCAAAEKLAPESRNLVKNGGLGAKNGVLRRKR